MAENNKNKDEEFAIVRVRGFIDVGIDIERTLNQLNLYKKNYCVVVPANESYTGMVRKVNDYVTWGEIDEETYSILVEKRGEEHKRRLTDKKGKLNYNRFLDFKGRKMNRIFRLNSPKKGYGRKGIKIPFSKGGALGYRSDKINELIKRML